MIASRDYCHAPLGVSSFSFSLLNVWEMTTMVDKIACHLVLEPDPRKIGKEGLVNGAGWKCTLQNIRNFINC